MVLVIRGVCGGRRGVRVHPQCHILMFSNECYTSLSLTFPNNICQIQKSHVPSPKSQNKIQCHPFKFKGWEPTLEQVRVSRWFGIPLLVSLYWAPPHPYTPPPPLSSLSPLFIAGYWRGVHLELTKLSQRILGKVYIYKVVRESECDWRVYSYLVSLEYLGSFFILDVVCLFSVFWGAWRHGP